jgi:hypothetical protein
VGGGIGSTSMLLAEAFPHLNFIVQERQVVVQLGEKVSPRSFFIFFFYSSPPTQKAWRARSPELLDSGRVTFAVHDFFTRQPVRSPAVFFLRVVVHDWPDGHARRLLARLREAAGGETKLVIADFVMPLACVDDLGGGGGEGVVVIEGAERALAGAPLLANLGKASANVYWMDMSMRVMFNSQERTLRETVRVAGEAGWRVVRVVRSEGLFGHIVAVPGDVCGEVEVESGGEEEEGEEGEGEGSRCGTPTFGSRVDLPSVEELARKFGGAVARRGGGGGDVLGRGIVLEKKKRPSPLGLGGGGCGGGGGGLVFGVPLSGGEGEEEERGMSPMTPVSPTARVFGSPPSSSSSLRMGLVLPSSPPPLRKGIVLPSSPSQGIVLPSSPPPPLKKGIVLPSSPSQGIALPLSPPPPPLRKGIVLPSSPSQGIVLPSSPPPPLRKGIVLPSSPSPPLKKGIILPSSPPPAPRRERSASTRGGVVLAVAARIEAGLPMEPGPEE